MSLSLFDKENESIIFKPLGADIEYFPSFFNTEELDYFFKTLLKNIKWQQDKLTIYGKEVNLPRLTAWYGETGKTYMYSGIKMDPLPWNKELTEIKMKIETKSGVEFNSVLLNLYRNGNDHLSWHADDELELGNNVNIGSVNFGTTRDFQLKHRLNKEIKKINISLEHGSFLLMKHPTQINWLHRVPKRSKISDHRINLTFRRILG